MARSGERAAPGSVDLEALAAAVRRAEDENAEGHPVQARRLLRPVLAALADGDDPAVTRVRAWALIELVRSESEVRGGAERALAGSDDPTLVLLAQDLADAVAVVSDVSGQLAGYVYVDTVTSDIGGYVEAAKGAIARDLKLPTGAIGRLSTTRASDSGTGLVDLRNPVRCG